jgi:glycosyltransferase involved in cell wall biosynthesis
LTEALVKLGHEVTLYASGDSITRARLRAGCNTALRFDRTSVDPLANHVYLAERVFQDAKEFDMVHSHIDYIGFPLLRRLKVARVTTLHGRLDLSNLQRLYHEYSDEPLVSISNHQRLPLAWASWKTTVYHGLPEDLYRMHEQPGKYLAFLGRISPEKRVDNAIEIACAAGLPLKIAAKVDKVDVEYFETVIRPLLNRSGVEYIGEIGETEKDEFLGNALALLFPINWPEPFGLVMIEALACGTPVIARARGSVPEIIEHGQTGFVYKDTEEAVQAVTQIPRLSRRRCRQAFETRFTATRMAADYLALYDQMINAGPRQEASKDSESVNQLVLEFGGSRRKVRPRGPRYSKPSAHDRHHSSPGSVLHKG